MTLIVDALDAPDRNSLVAVAKKMMGGKTTHRLEP
jgi:hypothetical protein